MFLLFSNIFRTTVFSDSKTKSRLVFTERKAMTKKLLFYVITIFSLFSFFCVPQTVDASENTVDYSISANLPENQRAGNATYFDLTVTPGQEQELTVNIFNSSDKEQTFILEANTAVTNNNGIIDYTRPDKKQEQDSTLLYAFSDLITHDETITVGANSNEVAIFKLNVPKASFDGMILGGFHVRQETPERTEGQINNTYSYALGVVLRENEKEVTPDLKLTDITSDLNNYRPQVSVNLQNVQPINIQELAIKANIRKKGQDKVLKSSEKQGLSMAPNSNFDFAVSWEDQGLEAGEYELELSANDQAGNDWYFEESFTITKEQAETVNKSALGLSSTEDSDNRFLYVLLGVVAVLIVLVLYFMRRQRALVLQQEMLRKQRKRKKRRKKQNENSTDK